MAKYTFIVMTNPTAGKEAESPLSGFRDTLLTYMDEVTAVGQRLLGGIAVGLGLAPDYFLERYTRAPTVLFRIFNYPPATAGADELGVGEHTDAAWPCDYAAAKNVKLRLPSTSPSRREKHVEVRPDVLVAEAELRPNEIQDFAEQLAELRKAAGPLDLRLRLKLELDGRGKSPAQDIVAKLNDLLVKVSKALSFK